MQTMKSVVFFMYGSFNQK